MKFKQPDRYVAAVFLEGRSILVCRELASDGYPLSASIFRAAGSRTIRL
jgi:hypothetical protein